MLRSVIALSALCAAMAFAPPLAANPHIRRLSHHVTCMQLAPSSIERKIKLTPGMFRDLDLDKSGTIDVQELKTKFGSQATAEIETLMRRADLDQNGALDYAEFERMINMQRFGDQHGGNLYVTNAIKLGLLKPTSILADGSASILVGNKGFDPLNCATNLQTLKRYREAEVKHGRLAMLAAAGWPLSEIVQPYLSATMGLPMMLATGQKAPSLVNGGLDKINPLFFMGIIIFSATVEATALRRTRDADYVPGDLGFDPLNLYTDRDERVKRDLELKELNNGRLAMLAITYYVLQEFVTKASVTSSTPFLFKSFL